MGCRHAGETFRGSQGPNYGCMRQCRLEVGDQLSHGCDSEGVGHPQRMLPAGNTCGMPDHRAVVCTQHGAASHSAREQARHLSVEQPAAVRVWGGYALLRVGINRTCRHHPSPAALLQCHLQHAVGLGSLRIVLAESTRSDYCSWAVFVIGGNVSGWWSLAAKYANA